MEFNKETIELYISQSKDKIELLKNDMSSYQYRIKQSEKEINTLQFLIQQYNDALKKILGNDG